MKNTEDVLVAHATTLELGATVFVCIVMAVLLPIIPVMLMSDPWSGPMPLLVFDDSDSEAAQLFGLWLTGLALWAMLAAVFGLMIAVVYGLGALAQVIA